MDIIINHVWRVCECGHAELDHDQYGCDSVTCYCNSYWPSGLIRKDES